MYVAFHTTEGPVAPELVVIYLLRGDKQVLAANLLAGLTNQGY
jgi:hypothetical protein